MEEINIVKIVIKKRSWRLNNKMNMNKNMTNKYIIGMAFLLFAGFANAQDKLTLTVEDALQTGLKNSKTLHSSLMKVKASEAKVKETNTSQLPTLSFTGSYTRLSSVDPFALNTPFGSFNISSAILNNYGMKLSVSQPIFTGFKIENGIKMAELSAGATQEDYNKDKSELSYNIKNAYWSLFKAKQMKTVLDETVEQIKAHLTDAQNLMQQGMLTNNDVLKIEVQLSDALFKQSDAKNAVRLAAIGLNNTIGIPLNTETEIKSTIEFKGKELADLDDLVNKANEKRSELKAASLRIKTSEANIGAVKSAWYPQIFLTGDYNYNRPNSRIYPNRDQFDGTWDVTLGLSFNIWNWGATGRQAEQAEAQLSQTIDAMGSIKDGITLEVTQNYLNFQQTKEKISISELAVKQADENLRITSEKFKGGLALSSEVVDADAALLQAKINHTNSMVEYELAKASLSKAIGE